jgi:amino acid transporter
MALDEVLPFWFAKVNSKGSFPRIVLGFLILCISILFITQGDLLSLGGVYAISFLSVMSMFAIGNIILKVTRADLKRYYTFPVILVLIASLATLSGVIGNIILDIRNLGFFLMYFIPAFLLVRTYMARHYLTIFFHKVLKHNHGLQKAIESLFHSFTKGKYILFIHRPDRLFEALKYIDLNETGRNIVVVHCQDKDDEINHETWNQLQILVPLLPEAGVFPHLKLQLEQLPGKFGPGIIDKASETFKVTKNRIFIGSIHHYHPFDYDELGGVRIIV